MIPKTLALVAALALSACGQPAENTADSSDLTAAAQQIAVSSIIVDTHIDVPYRLEAEPADISKATDGGDFDYPRAVAGGLNAAFMSIYTPANLEAAGDSRATADKLIDLVYDIVAQSPDKFAIALTPEAIREHFTKGIISLPMGMENGSPIEGDLANLEYFYDRGIRYVTLTHSLSNHIADSSYDENRQWEGLSEFGADVVREMNRLGMMIDVSHVSDDAFWQVIEISEAPVIASHSSARHFTPGFERNMSDEMIRAIAAKDGVVQINFGSGFITATANKYGMARRDARSVFLTEHPQLDESAARLQADAAYAARNGPFPYATLDDVLDHFDYVVSLAGVDHVGIGSDFDGVGDSLPTGLKDVSSYPNLVAGLLQRGYSEEEVRKILGENLLRVWDAVAAHAASAYGAKK